MRGPESQRAFELENAALRQSPTPCKWPALPLPSATRDLDKLPARYKKPRRAATATAWARLSTPSFMALLPGP
jgi:hypothetical protein